tara:strand:- start:477 stop:677 length:201 start_codon:yes stop_codon:yes gene_type:complete
VRRVNDAATALAAQHQAERTKNNAAAAKTPAAKGGLRRQNRDYAASIVDALAGTRHRSHCAGTHDP